MVQARIEVLGVCQVAVANFKSGLLSGRSLVKADFGARRISFIVLLILLAFALEPPYFPYFCTI